MITDWTKHLKDPASKAELEKSLRFNHREVLDLLRKLLEEYGEALDRSEIDPTTFNQPGWAYRQAYKNGYRACLWKINRLLDLDHQKGPK